MSESDFLIRVFLFLGGWKVAEILIWLWRKIKTLNREIHS